MSATQFWWTLKLNFLLIFILDSAANVWGSISEILKVLFWFYWIQWKETKLTTIFWAMTSGSSHTDSTKNTWNDKKIQLTLRSPIQILKKKKKRVPSCFKHTLYPFCSANMMMVLLLSLVVLVASKTWNNMEKQALCSRSICFCVLGLQQTSGTESRTHRNLSSFYAQVLPYIIKSWQSALTVERHERFLHFRFVLGLF